VIQDQGGTTNERDETLELCSSASLAESVSWGMIKALYR